MTAGLPFGSDYLRHFALGGFVEVAPAPPPPPEIDALHDGERYAISLALAERVPLLVEDRDALGLLLQGHGDGIISMAELNDALAAMRRAGRISQALLEETQRSRNQ